MANPYRIVSVPLKDFAYSVFKLNPGDRDRLLLRTFNIRYRALGSGDFVNIAGAGAGGGLITCQEALVALNAEPRQGSSLEASG